MIPFDSDALFVIIDGRQQKGVQTQAKSWVASVEFYHNHLGLLVDQIYPASTQFIIKTEYLENISLIYKIHTL